MNIEDLLNQHKKELSEISKPPEVWAEIDDRLNSRAKTFSFYALRVAAALLIGGLLTLTIYTYQLQYEVDRLRGLSALSEEYSQLESDYQNQIKGLTKQVKLRKLRGDRSYDWAFEELAQLNRLNDLYNRDIGLIEEDRLIHILIDQYEKKIQLLKRIQLQQKRHEYENSDNTLPTI